MFDSRSGTWELISGLNYLLGSTCAVAFENIKYAAGHNYSTIVKFDPSTYKHEVVFTTGDKFRETPLIYHTKNLVIKGERL